MSKELIFISSVQSEFETERQAIKTFLLTNRLIAKFFDVFLFEDLPSKDKKPNELYMEKVEECSILLALYGKEYGSELSPDGLSPTEKEFDRATDLCKERLVFISSVYNNRSHPKLIKLVTKVSQQLKYSNFSDLQDLLAKIFDSLIDYLSDNNKIQSKPFDSTPFSDASLDDISQDNIQNFLLIAKKERNIALPISANKQQTLTHLNLLNNGQILNSSILLFADNPQKYFPSAVVKCAHFHGSIIEKPIPSYQVFDGTLFMQADQSVDFIMSKLNRTVNSRTSGPQTVVDYEIPKEAISEIIVNAIAHRDYFSNASVQVCILSDRIEISNPGHLPRGYTPYTLTIAHESNPFNPHIARTLYYAHYIEHFGTGTLDVIKMCNSSNLPEPEFFQRGNDFVVILWRNWLTDEVIRSLNLNERQMKSLPFLKQNKRITNKDYSDITGVSRATIKRDLDEMVNKGILSLIGTKRGSYYELNSKV
jgi:ATP-dependent DNA helicase RecG